MYAFALWDSDERQLILARDPLGIKPLVRTLVDGSLLFASEFKAFVAMNLSYLHLMNPLLWLESLGNIHWMEPLF